jgi:hypothetical protein
MALLSGLAAMPLLCASRSLEAQPTEPVADHRQAKFRARLEAGLRVIAADPRLSSYSHEELYSIAEFVVGNLLYVSLHEIGHALIDALKLGVLGREEDAADAFATITMLDLGGSFSQNVLMQAMNGWVYSHWRSRKGGLVRLLP